jgi:type IV pilus assembly protein PilY1
MKELRLFIIALMVGVTTSARAITWLDLADEPLYNAIDEPPLVMLVMGRDHTLYYEAYNDASDLDADGDYDIYYNPSEIDYYGYFDSYKCYTYDSADGRFEPSSETSDKTCSGLWSGDFLNYITTSRMDALRKVLYGGMRSTDSSTDTVLERTFIPQDAHSWGKSYTSADVDGYDISEYTPLSSPTSGGKHFFGNVTYDTDGDYDGSDDLPILRVVQNVDSDQDIWDWASTERPVLSTSYYSSSATNYTVRVQVCVSGLLEDNCEEYPDGNYKPTGLLHDYGEDGSMEFGLITGSYEKNLSGGVLRQIISDFSNEIDTDSGIFEVNNSASTYTGGIVDTINKLRIYGFKYGSGNYYHYDEGDCGWITTGAISDGECTSWGNPIGEMLYESLRYFSGAEAASTSYSVTSGRDSTLGLPAATWDDPYDSHEYCASPYNLVISDINPSYDSDQLPGSNTGFTLASTYTGTTLSDFNITSLIGTINNNESLSGDYFIGESLDDDSNTTGAPTAKDVESLANIRGLSPEEPTKEGSYSVAGAAYYGLSNDLRSDVTSDQNANTMVVAISSPLPEIEVDVNGNTVTIVPYAKSVNSNSKSYSIDDSQGSFQPTNTIVDYYIDELTDTSGTFRINFEDVEQGADHDMDMIVEYSYVVDGDELQVTLNSTYAAGGIDQHAGYVISGTTADGIYLDVKDQSGSEVHYYLDTPLETDYPYPCNSRSSESTHTNNSCGDDLTTDSEEDLPLTRTRTFTASGSSAAQFLESPLWYAAKWGGFEDSDSDGVPDLDDEWDSDDDGDPDNYYLVTNAGNLSTQLAAALNNIASGDQSITAPVYSSLFLSSGSWQFLTEFDGENWDGDVMAYEADSDGNFDDDPTWEAADLLDAVTPSDRTIYSRNDSSGDVFEFKAPTSLNGSTAGFSDSQITELLGSGSTLDYLKAVVNYLRGVRTHEDSDSDYDMRERDSVLGDMINSSPYYVGSSNGHDVDVPLLVFGANDGMVHILKASSGVELAAYVPASVYSDLNSLTLSTYSHKYIVDGGLYGYSETDSSGSSTTTVVGTLGTGHPGFYAIDVSNDTFTDSDFLWEVNTDTDGFSNLGSTNATPMIAELANGDVGVIIPGGYNPSTGEASLFIANLDDGSLISELKTGVSSDDDPNGESRSNALAQPVVVDLDSDDVVDRIYAGDLFGNLWVWDVSSESTSDWAMAIDDDKPLFQARSPTLLSDSSDFTAQPITTRPSVGTHPYGLDEGVLVAFGTGQYIENDDNNTEDEPTQSFYVIWDKLDGTQVSAARQSSDSTYDDLLEQTIEEEDESNRLLSENTIDWDQHDGWYLDLINTEDNNTDNYGERQVTNSLLVSSKIIFTTALPSEDTCAGGGESWYMEMSLYTGNTWDLGTSASLDEDDEDDTINNDSSNQKLSSIASSPSLALSVSSSSSTTSELSDVTESTCVTSSDGTVTCYSDSTSSTGRLSWKELR